jgi:site-specific recombinase XerD
MPQTRTAEEGKTPMSLVLVRRHKQACQDALRSQGHTDKQLREYHACNCRCRIEGTNRYGLRFRKSLKTRDWEEALAMLEEYRERQPENPRPGKQRMALEPGLDQWLAELQPAHRLTDKTVAQYRRASLLLINHMRSQDRYFLDEVRPEDLTALQAKWDGKIERSTIHHRRTRLSMWLNYAVLKEWIDKNPYKNMIKWETVDEEEGQNQTLPLDEGLGVDTNWQRLQGAAIPYILAHLGTRSSVLRTAPETFLLLLQLMYHTGLRISDALRFTPARLDQAPEGHWTYPLRQHKVRRRGRKAALTVVFSRPEQLELAPKLKRLPAACPEGFAFWNGQGDSDHYAEVFVRGPLEGLGRELGFTQVLRPHRFRDSFAVNEINRGTSIFDLKEMLGHSNMQTTIDHYLPWIKSREAALAARNRANVIPIKKAG